MTDLIYWTAIRDEQTPTLTPSIPFESYLSMEELQQLSSFRFPKRRSEWLLGRWSIKYLLRHSLFDYKDMPEVQVQVKNEPEGMPFMEAVSSRVRLPLQVSISHREHIAFCALTAARGVIVGADLEWVENRPPSFLEDYFTSAEYAAGLAYQGGVQDLYFTLLWSLKEAVLKAVGKGLRLDTRRVEISGLEDLPGALQDSAWRSAAVTFGMDPSLEWRLSWRHLNCFIYSVAAGFPNGAAPPQWVEVPPDLE